jgi:uncharacterized membrane protein
MMNRPKINLPVEGKDKLMEHYSWVTLIAIWVIALYAYFTMSDVIPVHFDENGKADGYGGKGTIFILPSIISVAMILVELYINKPYVDHFAQRLTVDEIKHQLAINNRTLRMIKCLINTFLLYFSIEYAQALKTDQLEFSLWSLAILMTLVVAAIGYQRKQMTRV